MELLNEMYKARDNGAAGSKEWNEAIDLYLRMAAPITPHIAEELWAFYGKPYSIHTQAWPKVDEEAARQDEITLAVQINGKVRERITVSADATEEFIRDEALRSIERHLEGKTPKKIIVVKNSIVSVVI
jgi:leucyl-tRNA synthetase